ncbi:SDR family oxidoreductase [Microbacterium sp.]|uniref:SDR family oxidoreductase n=1 Tax=Microbacterium sp. TaxID=51671 RepID=UPI002FE10C17
MRIAVAGGTGTVGRYAVDAAHDAGHEVVVLSRASGADVRTGAGLAAALAGADAVIDVTNLATTLSAKTSVRFFETAAHHLLAAEQQAGVGHHVALSIVGIDGIDTSYYAGKLAQERAVAAGPVPFTIVRAGQFHEFAGQILGLVRGPFAPMPRTLMRPVSAREVGAYLVQVAETGPIGRARDLVGPHDETLADLARRQLAFDGIRRRVIDVRLPGAYGRGLASGALRGGADAAHGTVTFDEWLRSPDHARS